MATARRSESGPGPFQCYSRGTNPPLLPVFRLLVENLQRFSVGSVSRNLRSRSRHLCCPPPHSRADGGRRSEGRSPRALRVWCHANREVRYGGQGMLTVEYSLPDIEELARLVDA